MIPCTVSSADSRRSADADRGARRRRPAARPARPADLLPGTRDRAGVPGGRLVRRRQHERQRRHDRPRPQRPAPRPSPRGSRPPTSSPRAAGSLRPSLLQPLDDPGRDVVRLRHGPLQPGHRVQQAARDVGVAQERGVHGDVRDAAAQRGPRRGRGDARRRTGRSGWPARPSRRRAPRAGSPPARPASAARRPRASPPGSPRCAPPSPRRSTAAARTPRRPRRTPRRRPRPAAPPAPAAPRPRRPRPSSPPRGRPTSPPVV